MIRKILQKNTRLKRVFAMLLLWVLVMSSLTGCDNRAEALELAKVGQATTETMAKYYESLIQDTYDVWDYEAFRLSIVRQPSDPVLTVDGTKLRKRVEELNKRIKLVKNLASTYKSLQELSSYDASGEVSKSVGDLSDSIRGLGIFPDSGINPTAIFQMVAQDLVAWKQSKDIRKGSALILQVLQKLYDLFDKESPAYKSIVEEKGNKIIILMNYLIGKKKVTSLGLLQKIPDSFGLKLVEADKPVEDEDTKRAMIEMITVRGQRIAQMSAQAADGIKQSIAGLIDNHRKLQQKQGLTLSNLMEGLERAKAYIDEINKLRKKD